MEKRDQQTEKGSIPAKELREALMNPGQFFDTEGFTETEKRSIDGDDTFPLPSKRYKGISYTKADGKIKIVETR